MKEYLFYLVSMLMALCFSLFATREIIKFAYRQKWFDKPGRRKIHRVPVPRLGGMAFLPVTAFVLTLLLSVVNLLDVPGVNERIFNERWLSVNIPTLVLISSGMMVLYVTGLIDDMIGVRYRNKFVAQIIAGVFLCLSGNYLQNLHGVFGLYEVPLWLGWTITIFAIVFVTNAINFIDGIDGLASSLCAMSLIYYFLILAEMHKIAFAAFTACVIGCVLAFIFFNLHGTPQRRNKTFMGDTGSLFLGYMLAMLGVIVDRGTPIMFPDVDTNAMVVAFVPLVLPCYDAVRVVLERLSQHHNPFKADKSHIHHKLLKLGFSQHAALALVLGMAVVLSIITWGLSLVVNVNVAILLSLVLWIAVNGYLNCHINNKIKAIS